MQPLPTESSPVWLLLCALATWRITAFVCYDSGPFELATRLRRIAAAAGLVRLVTCFHCMSVWVSVLIVSALFEWHWQTAIVVLAVSGAVSISERMLGGSIDGQTDGGASE